MKKILFLLLIACSFYVKSLLADVIYSPYTHESIVISLEGIASYELAFAKSNSVNFWGGAGLISALGNIGHPAYGVETAIELRQYFNQETFNKFNIGLYTGIAYMKYPEFYRNKVVRRETSVGIVPGIKLTYKQSISENLVLEPYLSISTPFYKAGINNNLPSEPGIILTLGMRLGLNFISRLYK